MLRWRKAQPAVTALLGLDGDPQNPGTPSMMDYAKLADDPHAQKTLGEAFKLLDQQMGEIPIQASFRRWERRPDGQISAPRPSRERSRPRVRR